MDDTRVDFLFNLYFIGRMVKGHYRQENKDLMLSAAILHLLQKGEYTVSQLAKTLYSKLSALSEKISAMEKEGVIQKTCKGADEREQYVSLTPKGKKQIESILKSMKMHCIEFTKRVSNEELNHINPILKKIIS